MFIKRSLNWVNEACTIVGAAMFFVMILICFAQVIARYVFKNAMAWPEEASRFLFIWVAYLSMAYGLFMGSHLKIDAFVQFLGQRLQSWFKAFCMLISAAFMFFVAWKGWFMLDVVRLSGEVALTLPVPLYLVWFAIPFCFALTGIYSIYKTFTTFSEEVFYKQDNACGDKEVCSS